jgi:hypothetical protein
MSVNERIKVTVQRIIYKKPVVAYFSDFDCLSAATSRNRKSKSEK